MAQKDAKIEALTEQVTHLTEQVTHLTEQVTHLTEQVTHLTEQVTHLAEQIDQLTRALLGRSSERFGGSLDEQQLGLFGTMLPEAPPAETAADAGQSKRKPRGTHPGRAAIPAHLPRRVEIIDPEGVEREITEQGGVAYPGHTILGTEVSERIVLIPRQLYVLETHRPRLLCDGTERIVVAALPDRVMSKSLADETLVADVIIKKFIEHMPLYRQAEAFRRDYDWEVSRATLGNWIERAATALRPLRDELRRQVLASGYIQMDESGILVLADPEANADGGKSAQPKPKSHKSKSGGPPGKDARRHQGYMWLARDPVSKMVLFEYSKGRGHSLPKELLKDYTGYLQVDGWGAYRTALAKLHPVAEGIAIGQTDEQPIKLVGCGTHVRRKFFDAQLSFARAAHEALEMFRRMYVVEAACRHMAPEARLAYRLEHLAPVMTEFGAWIEQYRHQVKPKTGLGKAVTYALNQWPLMQAVLKDGRVELDNNGIENEVRRLALGRNNYMFAGSHGGAQNIAVLYSLLATCKACGVNERDWLNDVLKRLMSHPIKRIGELLPNQWKAVGQDGVA